MTLYEARTISLSIGRDWRAVYDFVHVPENFPRWASGLADGLERQGEDWIAQGPEGPVRVRFSPPNAFGVLDHVVTTADGTEIRCPLRVVANGSGCEIAFTLFRLPGVPQDRFEADAAWIGRDLAALKELLKGGETTQTGGDEA